MRIYGVLDGNGCHIDISRTEKGAKKYATMNGYNKVTCRFTHNAIILFERIGSKWVELKSKAQ